MVQTRDFIRDWCWDDAPPWSVTSESVAFVERQLHALGEDYRRVGDAAIHRSATVEHGAVLKGPAIVGPRCFVSSSALLRGGVLLGEDCTVGPCCELKSTIMLSGSKAAHLNFVGDSLIGCGVNIEAGAMIANYRNERADKRIFVRRSHEVIDTGVTKFGALVGDNVRIGANAVIAPGALLEPGRIVRRLELVDQHPDG